MSEWVVDHLLGIIGAVTMLMTGAFAIFYKFKRNVEKTTSLSKSFDAFSIKMGESLESIASTFHTHQTESKLMSQRLEMNIKTVTDSIESHKHDCEQHKNQLHQDLTLIHEKINAR